MDIRRKIELLQQEIEGLRPRWVKASIPMKREIEKEARNLTSQIRVFESVLRRRGELPPKEKPHVEEVDQLKLV